MKKKYVIKQERAVRYFTKHLCKKNFRLRKCGWGGGGSKALATYLILVLPTGACVFRVKQLDFLAVRFYNPWLICTAHSSLNITAQEQVRYITCLLWISASRSSGCEMNRTILHYKCRIGRGYVFLTSFIFTKRTTKSLEHSNYFLRLKTMVFRLKSVI